MLAVERYSGAATAAAQADHANAAGNRSLAAVGAAMIKIDRNKWGIVLVKKRRISAFRCSAPRSSLDLLNIVPDHRQEQQDCGNGSGGGKENNGGGGRGDNNGGGDDAADGGSDRSSEGEFGCLLRAEEIERQLKASGAVLPADMAEAARTVGLRELILTRYLDLQAAPWPLGPAIKNSPLLRNRMLADPSFLFKVFTEVAIDSGCATFAEVNKRGKDFWNEFELYMSDLLVGVVMDVALVSMLAPFVQFGAAPASSGRLSRALKDLPSSIFEAERPGRRFSVQQRLGTFFFKALQYGVVGFVCGLIGQGFASSIMVLKRRMRKSDHTDVPVPPLFKSAALWAVFMGVSSNTRYQIINGLERVVEGSVLAKRVPLVSMAFTVGVRFANNIYGGMQFVDWARMSGVQ